MSNFRFYIHNFVSVLMIVFAAALHVLAVYGVVPQGEALSLALVPIVVSGVNVGLLYLLA